MWPPPTVSKAQAGHQSIRIQQLRAMYGPDGSATLSADLDTDAFASMPVELMDGYHNEAVEAGCEPSERRLASQGGWFTKDFAPHSPAMEGDGEGTHIEPRKISAFLAVGDLNWQFDCSICSETQRRCWHDGASKSRKLLGSTSATLAHVKCA